MAAMSQINREFVFPDNISAPPLTPNHPLLHRDYWSPVSENNTSYCDMIVQFLRAIIRLHAQDGHPSNFSFQLDDAQKHALVALITHMDFTGNVLDDKAITRLHEFLWSLMNASSFHKGERWANVIQRFIWLRALRRDGNFYEATDYTPDLAKLKYFLNGTSLVHALWYQKDSEVDELESASSLCVLRAMLTLYCLFQTSHCRP
jgi:hypothetical protein